MMSSHLALPQEGHLAEVFHIFAYLKKYTNTEMVFDPTYPATDESRFEQNDWKNVYGNIKEVIPPNAPIPLGKEIILRCFVDADHAGDRLTR
jgi:hypothetical protein